MIHNPPIFAMLCKNSLVLKMYIRINKTPNSPRKSIQIVESIRQPMHIKGEKIMTITIKELPAKRVAVMKHHGDPMRLSDTLDKLITWAKAQSINLKPKAGEAFGFGCHDPIVQSFDHLCSDINCLIILFRKIGL